MKRFTLHGTVLLSMLAAATASGDEPPNYNAYYAAESKVSASVKGDGAGRHGAVMALDERRGVPTMFWADSNRTAPATHHTPAAAARWYLTQHASLYGLSHVALGTVYVHRVHDTGQGGIIVILRQRVDGIAVARSELKVLMARDLSLLAITGNLHHGAASRPAGSGTKSGMDAEEALSRALGDLYGLDVSVARILDLHWQQGGYQHFDLADAGAARAAGIRLTLPARVLPVYFPLPDRVIPAYSIDLLTTRAGESGSQGYAYVVAADDGRILYRQNRLFQDAYEYRVWADTTYPHTPADNPQEDYSPHPSGEPVELPLLFVDPVTILMEGFNTNPAQEADPWLPPGATETLGNNVDAYADHLEPDGFGTGDLRASITPSGILDHLFDPGAHPLSSPEQIQAAVAQLFYTTNWLHDFFYDAGFDEAAGNAQNDNYGRCEACLDGDALLAEAQDLGPDPIVRNNASMFVPADGMPPRMQMLLWSVPDLSRSFTAAGQSFETGIATFGPQSFATVTGPLVLVDDGTGIRSDGCEPIDNDVSGAIVLIDRGTCAFPVKVRNAELAGALGVIIANNQDGEPPPRLDGTKPPIQVIRPTLSITKEDGQFLKARLTEGSVAAEMQREAGIERDGSIDNTLIAHEWGHYLHNRLVECTTQQCLAQSEGWADFVALLMMVREGDDLNGTYAVGGYANFVQGDDSSYFGLRRVPYSQDFNKNALTFRHIMHGEPLPTRHPMRPSQAGNSEAHNAGEIWAAMLFDGYLGLLESGRHSFAETRRRMARYVVDGMVLAPVDPTYNEQRDAILLAALANDPQDALELAEGFARRGAGSCAGSPERDSEDLSGVIEDLALRPRMRVDSMTIDDSVRSCDGDGALDAEEKGMLRITVENPTIVHLRNTSVSVTTSSSNLSFPEGTALHLDELAPFASVTLELPVTLEPAVVGVEPAEISVSLVNMQSCETRVSHTIYEHLESDIVPTTIDTVESGRSTWQERSLTGEELDAWRPVTSPADPWNHVWYGINADTRRDDVLESAPLVIPANTPLVITFRHRHEFESFEDPDTGLIYEWDGGVIEVSTDGGRTWKDSSVYAESTYNGIIDPESLSYLAGRPGYVMRNHSWPSTDTVTLDFGTSLSGREVRVRFRIATDPFLGAHGWEIDDITVQGSSNRPFWGIRDDVGICTGGGLPRADAGSDQTVSPNATVILDASASTDPDGEALSHEWHQIGVPAVALSGSGMARAMFTAPYVEQDTTLVFQVKVSDGSGADTDEVEVIVLASPPGGQPDAGMDSGNEVPPMVAGGGGCSVGAQVPRFPWLPVLFWLALVAWRRRCR